MLQFHRQPFCFSLLLFTVWWSIFDQPFRWLLWIQSTIQSQNYLRKSKFLWKVKSDSAVHLSDNFCYRSFLLQSIFNSLVDIQLKWLNLLCWAYPQLIFLKLTESKICGWQTMTNIKRWQLANCKWCKLASTITVLCTCSFACTKVRAEPFHVHENQCTQILTSPSPGNSN